MEGNLPGIEFPASSGLRPTYLVFDAEATGLPQHPDATPSQHDKWPRVIQLAWLVFDEAGGLISSQNRYPDHGIDIPGQSTRIHGISEATMREKGENPNLVLRDFMNDLNSVQYVIGHNVDLDIALTEAELSRIRVLNPFAGKYKFCTMRYGRNICRIPSENGQGFKYPSLEELFLHCSSSRLKPSRISDLHNAYADAAYTAAIFFDLLEQSKTLLHHCQRIAYRFPELNRPQRGKAPSVLLKLVLPTLLSFLLFVLLAFVLVLPRFRNNIMTEKKLMIRELTTTAWSVLAKHHQDQLSGLICEEEAKRRAASEIGNLRYGAELKDYFWISDMQTVMVMHPYRPDLNGREVGSFSDPKGKHLFADFALIARNQGEGYLDYQWQWKDDSTLIVPKLSFVKLFEPWSWIIGTGIYLDDADREIASLTSRLWTVTVLISLIIAALLAINLRQGLRIERRRRRAEEDLNLSREKYRNLAESASDGLMMLMDGRIVFANPMLQEISGYTEDELMEQPYGLLFNDDDDLAEHIRSNRAARFPIPAFINCISGRKQPVVLNLNPIELNGKEGLILSISSNSMVQAFESRTLELLKRLRIAYFTAQIENGLYVIAANEEFLHLTDIESLEALKQVNLLDLVPDAAELKLKLMGGADILNHPLRLKKRDGSLVLLRLSLIPVSDGQCQGLLEDRQSELALREDLSYYQALSAELLAPVRSHVQSASAREELREAYLKMTELLIPHVGLGSGNRHMTRLISDTADLITTKLIQLSIEELGPPPAPFTFLVLGSQARMEMTLATDQDNAILFEPMEASSTDDCRNYFLALGSKVCDRLNEVGFDWCTGQVMAKNPKWCLSLSEWQKNVATWISHSSPEDLLRTSIFFDLRQVFASDGWTADPADDILNNLKRNDLYFLHMAKSLASASFVPARLSAGQSLSLKKCLMPITAGIRLYALRHGIREQSSAGRALLLKESGIMEAEYCEDLIFLHQYLSGLRLERQLDRIKQGRNASNEVDYGDLSAFHKHVLPWVFRRIEDLQQRIKSDFAGLLE